jgi:hypothetical protein
MKFLNTALVLPLSLCNTFAAAVLPAASPDIANLIFGVVQHYSPSHVTSFFSSSALLRRSLNP